jgi:hypothetical protein
MRTGREGLVRRARLAPVNPYTTQDLGTGWKDRLVELHVLAEHGDAEALAAALQWMGWDARARAVWDAVAADCTELGVTQAARWV